MTIDKFNFAGKKAFVRVDFNVPLDENFNIIDDARIRAALPTLKKILSDGGSVIIGSHLGRPKGVADKFSLKHIVKHVSELLGVEVQFANDCMGEEAAVKAAALQPGEALLLENLRFYAEEEGKPRGLAEDASITAKKLIGDIFEKIQIVVLFVDFHMMSPFLYKEILYYCSDDTSSPEIFGTNVKNGGYMIQIYVFGLWSNSNII